MVELDPDEPVGAEWYRVDFYCFCMFKDGNTPEAIAHWTRPEMRVIWMRPGAHWFMGEFIELTRELLQMAVDIHALSGCSWKPFLTLPPGVEDPRKAPSGLQVLT